MAKATNDEWSKLVAWFREREDRGAGVPEWERVVFGYKVLVDNCVDPNLDYLELRPELKAVLDRESP